MVREAKRNLGDRQGAITCAFVFYVALSLLLLSRERRKESSDAAVGLQAELAGSDTFGSCPAFVPVS